MPPTVSEANNKLMAENRKYIEIDDHDGDDDDLRRLLCNSQLTPVCGFLKTRSRSAGADSFSRWLLFVVVGERN